MTWVGPETVTSLDRGARHRPGDDPAAGLAGRAAGRSLVPVTALDAPARDRRRTGCRPTSSRISPSTVPTRTVEVGDPGVQYDADTPLRRPAGVRRVRREPPAGHTHEWGDDVAESAASTSDGPPARAAVGRPVPAGSRRSADRPRSVPGSRRRRRGPRSRRLVLTGLAARPSRQRVAGPGRPAPSRPRCPPTTRATPASWATDGARRAGRRPGRRSPPAARAG